MTTLPASYTQSEWNTRKTFVQLITSVCESQKVDIHWLCDNWIALLTKNGIQQVIYGYTFPLTAASTAALLRDKSGAWAWFRHTGIPAIPHALLRLSGERDTANATDKATKLAKFPLVVKPNANESGGFDVVKCTTVAELKTTIATLATRHQSLAVSPFIAFEREYRVVMLDEEPLLVFEKIRGAHEWRHNLGLGAKPRVVTDATIHDPLVALAQATMRTTQAGIAAVDIAATTDGLQIMEVNNGICMGHFAQHSPEYYALAREAYGKIVDYSLFARYQFAIADYPLFC